MSNIAIPPLIPASANFSSLEVTIVKVGETADGVINMVGNRIVNLGNPINDYDAVTKIYVDSQSGGNLTGPIAATSGITTITSQTGTGNTFVMSADPTINNLDVTTNLDVGGTLTVEIVKINGTGYIDMTNRKITNLATPVDNNDATTKIYVDSQISGNLTGPIAATAGVTTITSQTGTGDIFVMSVNPTISHLDVTTDVDIGGLFISSDTTNATTPFSGSIKTLGGISATKDIFIGGSCSAIEFLTTSDVTLKENIKEIKETDVNNFLKLNGYTYNFIGTEKSDIKYGLLAQDIENVGLEHIVVDKTDHKKVSYQSFIPLILETLKILNKKMDNINRRLDDNY